MNARTAYTNYTIKYIFPSKYSYRQQKECSTY